MNESEQKPALVEDWLKRQSSSTEDIDLSVVIPAFNEERRLPPTLIEMIDYFEARKTKYELVVVDDGSSDQTSEIVRKFERLKPQVHLLRLPENHGKGYAVRTGMLNASGKRVIFADADGASPIEEIFRLEEALEQGAEVAIGSRAMKSEETKVITNFFRKFSGRIFNFFVNQFLLPDVADTQCGFKMFSSKAARFIFERQSSVGYAFDVEILYIARRAGFKVAEVPINWHNVPGSKVNVLFDGLRMLRDIIAIRLRHRQLNP